MRFYKSELIAVLSGAAALVMLAAATQSSAPSVGVALPRSLAETLRGGGVDPQPTCQKFKTVECAEVAATSESSTCPAQTIYAADAEGGEYGKQDGDDYCGAQREGDPSIYDCTTVTTDIKSCAK
jgi:hypothetical protein